MSYKFRNQVHWLPSPFCDTRSSQRPAPQRRWGPTHGCADAPCLSASGMPQSVPLLLASAGHRSQCSPTEAHWPRGSSATCSPGGMLWTAPCWLCLAFAKTLHHKCALPLPDTLWSGLAGPAPGQVSIVRKQLLLAQGLCPAIGQAGDLPWVSSRVCKRESRASPPSKLWLRIYLA